MRLRPRHQRFADAFLGEARFNATEAARTAGYKGDRHVLAVRGCELLKNPTIVQYLRKCTEAAGAKRNEVLRVLARHMRGNTLTVNSNDHR